MLILNKSSLLLHCLLINSYIYSMQTSWQPIITIDEITKYCTILGNENGTIGHAAPHIKKLEKEDEAWQNILADKKCCKKLLNFTDKFGLTYSSIETNAVFIGSSGTIAYAKKYVQKKTDALERLNRMLVDTGNWIGSDLCWETQSTDVAKAILEITQNPNYINEGTTALINASKFGNEPLINLLIDSGALVNLTDEQISTTPLIQAVKAGNFAIIKRLLIAGADIFAQNKKNKTAFDIVNHKIISQPDKANEYKLIAILLKLTEKLRQA